MNENSDQNQSRTRVVKKVKVSIDDALMIRKVRRILKDGMNAEIRQDKRGCPKVLRVSREIEE